MNEAENIFTDRGQFIFSQVSNNKLRYRFQNYQLDIKTLLAWLINFNLTLICHLCLWFLFLLLPIYKLRVPPFLFSLHPIFSSSLILFLISNTFPITCPLLARFSGLSGAKKTAIWPLLTENGCEISLVRFQKIC